MDNHFFERLVCSACELVYHESQALDATTRVSMTCPRCGACDSTVSSIECIYGAAQALLMRF
jgi:rubredoxin